MLGVDLKSWLHHFHGSNEQVLCGGQAHKAVLCCYGLALVAVLELGAHWQEVHAGALWHECHAVEVAGGQVEEAP